MRVVTACMAAAGSTTSDSTTSTGRGLWLDEFSLNDLDGRLSRGVLGPRQGGALARWGGTAWTSNALLRRPAGHIIMVVSTSPGRLPI